MKLRPAEMQLMQRMVQQLCGLTLEDHKDYLIETRLGRIAARHGCDNFNELYFRLRYGGDSAFVDDVVEAITTHETQWFRDDATFDALQQKMVPDALSARLRLGQPRTLRIWSAACSTGQEPYSIAMILREALPTIDQHRVEILATDISKQTLQKAQQGRYSALEMARTSRPQLMRKYFRRDGEQFVIDERVRRMVTFRERNLTQPLAGLGRFDIVFLRNVMIYFEAEQRAQVLGRAADALLPHGWLVLGASESLLDGGSRYVPQQHCGAVLCQPNAVPLKS